MEKQVSPVIEFFRRNFEALEVTRISRDLKRGWKVLFNVLAGSYSLFLIIGAVYSGFTPQIIRGFFMLFVSAMIFIKYPARSKSPLNRPSAVDFIFILMSIGAFGNFGLYYDDMAWRIGSPSTGDVFWGIIAIVIVLEACRRAMSFILPIISLGALVFAFSGAKVLIYDLAGAPPLVRIGCLAVLGVSLYLGGWLYRLIPGEEAAPVPHGCNPVGD